MTKYTVIYREAGESSPKRVVMKGADESSLRRECEAKGWQVLLIRGAESVSPSSDPMRRKVIWEMVGIALCLVLWILVFSELVIIRVPLSDAVVGPNPGGRVSFALRVLNCAHTHPFYLVCFLLSICVVGVMLWAGIKFFATPIAVKWPQSKVRRKIQRVDELLSKWLGSLVGLALLVSAVLVLLPFGLEAIGDATGLFNFPASKWMKDAFAILTR